MMETTWSKNGNVPSLDEYLEMGMTSIATHTMTMPALCFFNYNLKSDHDYHSITKLLMASSRLLNDIQSYQVTKLTFFNFFLLQDDRMLVYLLLELHYYGKSTASFYRFEP